MTTYYVATDGDNSNTGLSEAAPWADPGYASGQMVDGDYCYVKAGTYVLTAADVGVAGGGIRFLNAASGRCGMEGYDTTPGDLGTRPVLDSTGLAAEFRAPIYLDAVTNGLHIVTNLDVLATGKNYGVYGTSWARQFVRHCIVRGAATGYLNLTTEACQAIGCSSQGYYICPSRFSVAASCGLGFVSYLDTLGCIANQCGTGMRVHAAGRVTQSIAYGCTSHGFDFDAAGGWCVDCIAIANGGYGYDTIAASALMRCASYGNISGRRNVAPLVDMLPQVLSGNPFVDAPSGNFNLNAIAGAGAVLRALRLTL